MLMQISQYGSPVSATLRDGPSYSTLAHINQMIRPSVILIGRSLQDFRDKFHSMKHADLFSG